MGKLRYTVGRAVVTLFSEGPVGVFRGFGRIIKRIAAGQKTVDELYDFVAEVDTREPAKLVAPKNVLDSSAMVLNWIIPDFGIGSGGHLNIFRTMHHLESFGHTNRLFIVQNTDHHNGAEAKEAINNHFAPLSAEVFIGTDNMPDSDAVIATSWETAYPAFKIGNTRRKFYFIQDLETLFFPAGSQSSFAENTYRFGFDCITAGPWLTKVMHESYGVSADYFDFAFNPDIYSSRGLPRKRQIVFYARQVTPRRGYELGVLALKKVMKRHPDVELVFVGWPENERLSFNYRNLGILQQDDLATLYNESMLGIVISLTNPSLVNKEMMASGLPVVDVKGPPTEGFFGKDSLVLADRNPHALADAICALIEDEEARKEQSTRGLEYVKRFNWQKSARQVEEILKTGLAGAKSG